MSKLPNFDNLNQEQLNVIFQKLPPVFSIDDATTIFRKPREKVIYTLCYFESKGWLTKVRRGFYMLVSIEASTKNIPLLFPWIITERFYSPCYIGACTAAKHWGLINHDSDAVMVFTSKKGVSGRAVINGTDFAFHQVLLENMFGLQFVQEKSRKILISDPSRTIIDCIVASTRSGGLNNVIDILIAYLHSKHKNMRLLYDYAKRLHNRSVFQRLGFLLELFVPTESETIKLCRELMATSYSKFDPRGKSDVTIPRWFLRISEDEIQMIKNKQTYSVDHIESLITRNRSILKRHRNVITNESFAAKIKKHLPPRSVNQGKMPSIYHSDWGTLADILHKLPTIFSIDEATTILKKPKVFVKDLLCSWAKKGWLLRAKKGLYVLAPIETSGNDLPLIDPWIVAEKFYSPCYVGGHSAAKHWGLTDQNPDTLMLFTRSNLRINRRPIILGAHFSLFYVQKKDMYGLLPVEKGRFKILITNPSRTIVDCLAKPSLGGGMNHVIEFFISYLKSTHKNIRLLYNYAKRHHDSVALKRLGFLLEQFDQTECNIIALCKKHITTQYTALDPKCSSDTYITEWRLSASHDTIQEIKNKQLTHCIKERILIAGYSTLISIDSEKNREKTPKIALDSKQQPILTTLQQLQPIFSVDEATLICKIPRKKTLWLLTQFTKKGLLQKVCPSLYMLASCPSLEKTDPLVIAGIIANKLVSPYYVGTCSAAKYWGLLKHNPDVVMIFTTKGEFNYRPRIFDAKFFLITVPKKAMHGLCAINKEQQSILISDPSRTLIDCLSRPDLGGGINTMIDLLIAYLNSKYKDMELLYKYAKFRKKNGAIFKRLGFLLEQFEPTEYTTIALCRRFMTTGYSKLDTTLSPDRVISKWNLWLSNETIQIIKDKKQKIGLS